MRFAPARLAAAAVLAAAALTAQAQTPPAPPAGPQPMMHPGMMGMHEGPFDGARMQERFQGRMDSLKRILQLTPAQDGAWNAWVAAMKPNPTQRPDHDAMTRMTTPQRIDAMKQIRAQHSAEMDKRADATKTLYAQLTPPQQKAFDEVSLKFLARHGGRGDRMHHGM